MAFTVDDLQDLLRLLERHPEWRAELRRYVLTEELLELPALVRQLAEAQVRTERQIANLSELQGRTEAQLESLAGRVGTLEEALAALARRVEALAEAQARTERRVEELAEAQARTERRVEEFAEAQGRTTAQLEVLAGRVGALDGEVLELRYARRAPAYFSRLARRLRVLDPSVVADLLDAAIEQSRLTEDERAAILAADLVLAGQRREDRGELYLLVEVSAGIGLEDVRRAVDRAGMLAKLGRPVVPVVAGRSINAEAVASAESSGVWQVLDGHARPPGER